MIRREWRLAKDWDVIGRIHDSPAPFCEMAAAAKIVKKAAQAGDAVALGILYDAGHVLAEQMIFLMKKHAVPISQNEIILAGGAWKIHPAMLASFASAIQACYPGVIITKPWFEPTLAGAASFLMEQGISKLAARDMLVEKFPDYQYPQKNTSE
jgi:N-acetylglucosamine kinase-like BadF-type ATPase